MKKHGKLFGVVLALAVMALILGSSVSAEEGPIKLGVISPASGTYADLGTMERLGMTMAVEEMNKRGGVLGREVVIIAEDSEVDPNVAARKAKKLIEKDKVDFLCGGISSAVANSISEVAQRSWKIYFNTNTNSDTCTGPERNHRVNFRCGPSGHQLTYASGPYMVKNFGQKWYFLTQDGSWGRTATANFKAQLTAAGGKALGDDLIPLGTRDFSSHLIKIRNAKPTAVIITVAGMDLAHLLEQIHDFGMIETYHYGFTLRDYPDVWAVGPEKNFGVFACEWYHTLDVPGVPEFVAWYKRRFPDAPIPVPENDVYYGYIGARAILRAAQRAGTTDGPAMIKQLEGHYIHDNMKHNPTWIRPWDHQFIQDVYVARAKTVQEMAGDRTDFTKILGFETGERIARTRQENPVQLEALPGE